METGFFIAFVSLSGGFGLGFILGFCFSELFESFFVCFESLFASGFGAVGVAAVVVFLLIIVCFLAVDLSENSRYYNIPYCIVKVTKERQSQ